MRRMDKVPGPRGCPPPTTISYNPSTLFREVEQELSLGIRGGSLDWQRPEFFPKVCCQRENLFNELVPVRVCTRDVVRDPAKPVECERFGSGGVGQELSPSLPPLKSTATVFMLFQYRRAGHRGAMPGEVFTHFRICCAQRQHQQQRSELYLRPFATSIARV